MTRAFRNGLLVALIHVAIVGAVAAKFAIDRARLPRLWVQAVPYDPDLPIRGRYVRISAVVAHPAPPATEEGPHNQPWRRVRLEAREDVLTAIEDPHGRHTLRWQRCGAEMCWALERPVAYFIPEHVPDPSFRPAGEQLWMEVSLPPKGPPRPLQLAVKRDGALTPLQLR